MTFSHHTALQINIYPLDMPHIHNSLPHQIRQWGGQVDIISITLDVRRSVSGRYRGDAYDAHLTRMREYLAEIQKSNPKIKVHEVDYSDAARKKVAAFFFAGNDVPDKAWDGGPFYTYFYGLLAADARYVFHIDGDMLFGGGSQQWMTEAITYLDAHTDVLLMAPLGGPPAKDTAAVVPYQTASTRVFFIDMQRFVTRVKQVALLPLTFAQKFKSWILGHKSPMREAEVLLGHTLRVQGLTRVDYLGAGQGMWSLHPPYRSEDFYTQLPDLIQKIETGKVPAGQLGDYDMNDSMIDWSSARATQTWPRRMARLFKHVMERFFA